MIDIIKHEAEHYLSQIRDNKPFSFARYGDGEVILMFNHPSVSNRNIGNLQKAVEPMMNIFRNQYKYYHCLLRCTFDIAPCFGSGLGETFKDFLSKVCPEMPFYDGEFWQDLSFCGEIERLTSVLDKHYPIFIGGKHLENLKYLNGLTNLNNIVVHDRKAWDDYSAIKDEIIRKIELGYRMFCFSMGYPGKIMIDDLFPAYGDKCFFIDFGSLFDPYCGILSRSGMKHVGWQKFQPFTKYDLRNSKAI